MFTGDGGMFYNDSSDNVDLNIDIENVGLADASNVEVCFKITSPPTVNTTTSSSGGPTTGGAISGGGSGGHLTGGSSGSRDFLKAVLPLNAKQYLTSLPARSFNKSQ